VLVEVEWDTRKPKAVQSAVSGESSEDNEVVLPISFQDRFPIVDAEVKRADMLKCAFGDQLGTLLEPVGGVDREVAAKAGKGDVAEFTRHLRTGPQGFLVGREELEDRPDYLRWRSAPARSRLESREDGVNTRVNGKNP